MPDALSEPEAFVAQLADIVRRHSIEVLLPVTEASLLAVLAHRENFPGVLVPFPDLKTVQRISDKVEVLSAAREVGIAVPSQVVVPDVASLELLADTLRFPLVAKPSRSVGQLGAGARKLAVAHARNHSELRSLLEALPPYAFPVLLQERIVGPGVGVFLLMWEGRCLALFSHRRIREKPPSGGVSVYRESIAPDQKLTDPSLALIRKLGWQGVAMVEYKMDKSTETPYLMEINGRFWGSLQLAVDAGVDFPVLLLKAAEGELVAAVQHYRVGVRSRWWWGDIDHVMAMFRRSRTALALPPDAPGRVATLGAFLVLWRPGDRNEVLRLSDPLPFLGETVDWILRR